MPGESSSRTGRELRYERRGSLSMRLDSTSPPAPRSRTARGGEHSNRVTKIFARRSRTRSPGRTDGNPPTASVLLHIFQPLSVYFPPFRFRHPQTVLIQQLAKPFSVYQLHLFAPGALAWVFALGLKCPVVMTIPWSTSLVIDPCISRTRNDVVLDFLIRGHPSPLSQRYERGSHHLVVFGGHVTILRLWRVLARRCRADSFFAVHLPVRSIDLSIARSRPHPPVSGASNTSAVKPSSSTEAAVSPRPYLPCSTYASPRSTSTVSVSSRGSAIQYSGIPASA